MLKVRVPSYEIGLNPLRRLPIRSALYRPLLTTADLVMPIIITPDSVESILPTFTLPKLPGLIQSLQQVGVRTVKLFSAARRKDSAATEAALQDTLLCEAIRACKDVDPILCVMVETCLCPYTDSGECVLRAPEGNVNKTATLGRLAQLAVCQARAGADVIGPAGMVEGSVAAVRAALTGAGFEDVAIMPHLIFDSQLYDGYRKAAGAYPRGGHRRAFHISPSRPEQALDDSLRFLAEGADMLLLEPALPIMDVLVRLREVLSCPLGTFCVSGEYWLLRATERPAIAIEFLSALKRAGADLIITYSAKEVAAALEDLNLGAL